MLSGILLILVTMLAVLGAYYLTELASQAGAKRKTLKNAVCCFGAQDAEQMWAAVLGCARPSCRTRRWWCFRLRRPRHSRWSPAWRGVTFASPGTVGAEVCRLLAVPQGE